MGSEVRKEGGVAGRVGDVVGSSSAEDKPSVSGQVNHQHVPHQTNKEL